MAPKRSLLLPSRKVHLYLGLFITPALLFFAFTGVYQTLGLHEAASDYHPPRLLAELGQIHKKQTNQLPQRRGEGPPGTPSAPTGPAPGASREAGASPGGSDGRGAGTRHQAENDTPDAALKVAQSDVRRKEPATQAGPGRQQLTLAAKQRQHLPLKLFFVVVGLGLFLNAVTGVHMAYKYDRNPWLVTGLLAAGIVLPVLLLRF